MLTGTKTTRNIHIYQHDKQNAANGAAANDKGKMMKTIAIKVSKRGIKFALAQDGDTFSVWKLCENYAAHCKGGMSQTWRYIERGMPKDAAETLFNRRAK